MGKAGKAARILAVVAVVLSTIGCDRLTKDIAARHLAGRPRLSMASDLVRLEYAENRGGFLSLGADLPTGCRTAIFNLGTAILLLGLGVWMCRRVLAGSWAIGPALLWAGGIANLADRVARGSVMDFLNVGVGALRTGIFNVADMAITAGVVLFVAEFVGRSDRGGRTEQRAAADRRSSRESALARAHWLPRPPRGGWSQGESDSILASASPFLGVTPPRDDLTLVVAQFT